MDSQSREILVLSWNFEDHDLKTVGSFPESSLFYSAWESSQRKLPAPVQSLMYLATCNRAELYLHVTPASAQHPETHAIPELLFALSDLIPVNSAPKVLHGKPAVKHFFSLVAGLKSMATGETQITGQVKRDFERARELNIISPLFAGLTKKALEVQKRVRTETEIGRNSVSLLSLFERAAGLAGADSALLGGTGDMSQKALRYFANKNIRRVTIVRKNLEAAVPPGMADLLRRYEKHIEFTMIDWEQLKSGTGFPKPYSVFLTATNSENAPLSTHDIEGLRAAGVLTVGAPVGDLGMPRNITGETRAGDGVINLDHLMEQSRANAALRRSMVQAAMPIIDKGIMAFWLDNTYRQDPGLISRMMKEAESDRNAEWESLIRGPLSGLSDKNLRILDDYLRKRERKSLKLHKEMFLELITVLRSKGDA